MTLVYHTTYAQVRVMMAAAQAGEAHPESRRPATPSCDDMKITVAAAPAPSSSKPKSETECCATVNSTNSTVPSTKIFFGGPHAR